MRSAPSSDVFGSYLKTVGKKAPATKAAAKKLRAKRPDQDASDPDQARHEKQASAEVEILKIVKGKSDAGETASTMGLMGQIKLPPSKLIHVISKLEESNLLKVSDDGEETLILTPLGEKFAS